MKKITFCLTVVLLIALTLPLNSFNFQDEWRKTGDKPGSYDLAIDNSVKREGKDVYTLKSIEEKIESFGGVVKTAPPDKYFGKRVRMTGYLKTSNVSQWSGLWFRIDQKDPAKSLAFDNMRGGKEDRSVKGTTDWKKCEIVLDVPVNAHILIYGVVLSGTGQVWFDDIKFEIVDSSVPTTEIDLETLKKKDQ